MGPEKYRGGDEKTRKKGRRRSSVPFVRGPHSAPLKVPPSSQVLADLDFVAEPCKAEEPFPVALGKEDVRAEELSLDFHHVAS